MIPKIQVPVPCHEKLENMTSTDCGSFCHSCQKTVFDFTNSTFEEFQQKREEQGEHVCGKFNTDEIGRIYFKRKEPRSYGYKIFLCAFVMCFNSWIFAADAPIHNVIEEIKSEMLVAATSGKDVYIKVIKNHKPLRNSRVELTINGKAYLAETDNRGRCIVNLPADLYIEEIKFDVEGGGIQTYEAYCKTNELSTRNIRIKFNRPKFVRGRGYTLGCPSF